jgi:cytochrome c peroxidase
MSSFEVPLQVGLACALSVAALGCNSTPANTAKAPAVVCDPANVAQCAEAQAMALPTELPLARGNAYGDDENAATLGFYLFFDGDLGKVGCPACHAPELAFGDGKPTSKGVDTGTRNAPTIFNAGRLSVFFWDGRADSLWSQPLFAIENPIEMASTRLELAHLLETDPKFNSGYERAFGPLPDMSSWPAAGKPGDAAFDELSAETQAEVNRVAANVGKALEAYMRKNTSGPSALDRYLAGDDTQIIPAAADGLYQFIVSGCVSCHSGPMLTDESFHDAGFPSLPDAPVDEGEAAGLPVLRSNMFNLAGPYADRGPGVPAKIPSGPGKERAFRTPSLRNVARTAPYGHDGAIATLGELMTLHAPDLTEEERGNILAFLRTLNGDVPARPWSNWPSPQ